MAGGGLKTLYDASHPGDQVMKSLRVRVETSACLSPGAECFDPDWAGRGCEGRAEGDSTALIRL